MDAVISFGCILVFLCCLKTFIIFSHFPILFLSKFHGICLFFFPQFPEIGLMPTPSPAGLRLPDYTCWLINLITFYIPSLQILTEAVSWGNNTPFTDSSSCNQSVRFRMHVVDEDLFPEQIFTFCYGEETCLYRRTKTLAFIVDLGLNTNSVALCNPLIFQILLAQMICRSARLHL